MEQILNVFGLLQRFHKPRLWNTASLFYRRHVLKKIRWNLANLGSHLVPWGEWSLYRSQSCSRRCSCRWSGSQRVRCYSWWAWTALRPPCLQSPPCSDPMSPTPGQSPSRTRPDEEQKKPYWKDQREVCCSGCRNHFTIAYFFRNINFMEVYAELFPCQLRNLMFSMLYGRGRSYTSSEKVQKNRIQKHVQKKQKQEIEASCLTRSLNIKQHIHQNFGWGTGLWKFGLISVLMIVLNLIRT